MPRDERQIDLEGCRLDETAALASLDGQRELLGELAEIFCEDMPGLVRALEESVDSGDAVAARHAVHSLKGLASTFFAPRPVEVAQRMEDFASEGNLAPLRDGGLEELRELMQALAADLASRQLKKFPESSDR